LLDSEGKKIGIILGLALHRHRALRPSALARFRSILVLLFLLGVGGGIVVTGANALVSDVSEAHRGTALNLVNLFFGLGGLATPFSRPISLRGIGSASATPSPHLLSSRW